MADQNNPQHTSSRRFIKGVHRASFSPVDADASYVPPPVPVPTPVTPSVPPTPTLIVPTPLAKRDPAPRDATPKKKSSFFKTTLFVLLGIALVAGAGFGYYKYITIQKELNALRSAPPDKFTQMQDQAVIDKVRSHMDIPRDKPIINTITNADTLNNQLFFAKAKNGDKVLVFTTRAILYRPSEDKIIEVAAVTPTTPTPTPSLFPRNNQ
jgi:hypothetical protein